MDWVIGKTLGALVIPPGILVVLLLVSFALTWRRPPLARALLGASILVLYAFSTNFVSEHLLLMLQPEPRDPRGDPGGQAIVVLGGGLVPQAPEYGGDTVNSATLVRVRYAATLYRSVKKPVLVSGGAARIYPVPEARMMRDTLQREFQVPVTWVEDASSNTLENARASSRMLSAAGISRIYLVTHAWHMARARYAFETTGLTVIPAPTAYASPAANVSLLDFLPSAGGLLNTSWFFHEVIGLGWYHLRVAIGR